MKAPIFTGYHGKCHLQGIAVDKKGGYIYYSFTTKLIKATLDGKIIGSVDGLVGHLGCIAFNEDDGCVYGSLEYKNDSIGKGILNSIGSDAKFDDAFYVVKFDVSKIDRPDMSALGVMTAVYLKEVADDYNGQGSDKDGNPVPHRHGCSGIDGLTFAPHPDKKGSYLYVAYGVYGDVNRNDNDYQVLLCYDHTEWAKYQKPLDQNDMHTSGPEKPLDKFFVHTGNTTYGVQNLEYDKFTDCMFMAVYRGAKPEYENYSLFAVDCTIPPKTEKIGKVLSLKTEGWHFPYGSTGLFSFGDGNWLISRNKATPDGQCAYIHYYKWDEIHPFTLL